MKKIALDEFCNLKYLSNLVIYCNPTGSDGRGDFSNIRGKYGTVDYDDLMAFCDRALKTYPDMDKKTSLKRAAPTAAL